MWRLWRRKSKFNSWTKRFVKLSDDPDTPGAVMRSHIRQGLDSNDINTHGAAMLSAMGIARGIHEQTGDGTAIECMNRYDYPGFLEAWERAEFLDAQTVEGRLATGRPTRADSYHKAGKAQIVKSKDS